MKSIKVFVFIVLSMLCQSCTGLNSRIVDEAGANELRAFALTAKAQYTDEATDIPRASWPAGLSAADCKAVRYYIDGIMIVTSEDAKLTKGVFVGWNDDAPSSGSGIEFTASGERIYTFVEKRRQSRKSAP